MDTPELTTQLDDGVIPSRKVNTRWRVVWEDVHAHKKNIDARRLEALEE